MSDPGDFVVDFGQWAMDERGGVPLHEMTRGDVEFVAFRQFSRPEARDAARAYIRQNPDKFPQRRTKGKIR